MDNNEWLNKIYLEVQRIKKQGINTTDQEGNTALMKAIINRQTVLSKILLKEENIDLNVQNKKGLTALMLAGKKNIRPIANRILDIYSTKGIIDLVIKWKNSGHS